MTTTVNSLLSLPLGAEPDVGDGSREDLIKELRTLHDAIIILQGEVERIRIATGTAPPP